MSEGTIVVLSGGLDSTVLLLHCIDAGLAPVEALSFNYGQRHDKELLYARKTCRELGIEWDEVDLRSVGSLLPGSSQTDSSIAVPEGHYEAESMKLTVVPNRNAIMLMCAMGIAGARDRARIAYAAHAGDHAIYPDCRPEFVEAARKMGAFVGWGEPIRLYAPFNNWSKAEIVIEGNRLQLFERFGTWSCYKGGVAHCGVCGTCTERREAFRIAGVRDSTRYLSDEGRT